MGKPPAPADFSVAVTGSGGFAPCKKITKFAPFPIVGRVLFERGSGGWGQTIRTGRGQTDNAGDKPRQSTGAAG